MTDNVETQIVEQDDTVELTTQIVAAYVSNNSVPASGLADLIVSVHSGLLGLGKPSAPAQEPVTKATPAQVKKSIGDEGLISFEDGRPYKSLKRHLSSRGLTPEGYRAKYGLPSDYPMVAPSYARQRSELARTIGLGRARQPAAPKSADVAETVTDAPKARGGRRTTNVATPSASAPKKRGRASKAVAAAE
ncbi:MucR family transcriptional regulator [Methylobacterium iners]|uniref:MucR family transcriptional regulator n=1 Tax=Methylobacterium iners TaxID=418707 RepID=A0ABQ4S207_9HYPH|nr:MucR family transcriptional regulator [Methylobacterium iners]GJD96901.1 hypothetical protein OCOJLMKI_4128 [Methylobacterium iners]